MKRCIPLLLLPLFLAAPLAALNTVFLEPAQPLSPSLKAQGGVSTGNVEGYDSLFVNPAAFSNPKSEITFFSLQATAHVSLTGLNDILDARESWSDLLGDTMQQLIGSLVGSRVTGQSFSTGAGWVGNTLGLGMMTQLRTTIQGLNLIDAKANVEFTTMGVIGMGWPLDVGLGVIRLGADLHPVQRTYSSISAFDLLQNFGDSSFLDSQTVLSGIGFGWDFGARWDYAGFQTGLVLRDIGGTRLELKEFTYADWVKSLGFPAGGDDSGDTVYYIPMVVAIGTSWTPQMGTLSSLFQPSVGIDLQIPIKNEFTQPSFWTWTHIGAQFKLLQTVSIRTGLNQGYLTFGLGARVLIVDFNLAVYTDELGRYSGTQRRPSISTEFAFKL